ncbi:MAG: ferritin-like domain-containing protein [Thermoplasmata archaeon]
MGTKGKEIVEIGLSELISDLSRVYSDQWMEIYLSWYVKHNYFGEHTIYLKEIMEKIYSSALIRAEKLTYRIRSLGGNTVYNPSEIIRLGNCRYPENININDLQSTIDALLNLKRCIIDVYNRILKKTIGKDPVTYHIIENMLEEEIEEEDRIEILKKR